MAKTTADKPAEAAAEAPASDPRIKTAGEFARLTPDEQSAFRSAEGTVTPDPAPPAPAK